MGRSRGGKAGIAILFALISYVCIVYYLAVENIAFRVLTTLACVGIIIITIAGRFAALESVRAKVSRAVLSNVFLVLVFLGLTGLGLGLGWSEAAMRAERARHNEESLAAQARFAAERAAADARFHTMSSTAHLETARTAMADGYVTETRSGGQLELAERHLHAISVHSTESTAAAEMLRECTSRQARALIMSARKAVDSGTDGDIFHRFDSAREQLRKVPPDVPEYATVETLLKEWRQREDKEHLAVAIREVDSGTDGDIFHRLDSAREQLRTIPVDVPEHATVAALLKEWRQREDKEHLEAARIALRASAYTLTLAHLAHISADSSVAAAATSLSKQAEAFRQRKERQQAQEERRQAKEEAGSRDSESDETVYYAGGKHHVSGGSVSVRSHYRNGTFVHSYTRGGRRR